MMVCIQFWTFQSPAQSEQLQDADIEVHLVSGLNRRLVKRQRNVLKFALRGKMYQYQILLFGLTPKIFTKCIDAALAPLRLQGIWIVNYLDNWLMSTQLRSSVINHRDMVLNHLHLILRVNFRNNVLLPSQQMTFLRVNFDSHTMRASLSLACVIDAIPVLSE